jgi:putative polyhydroxyalkanoate system protein
MPNITVSIPHQLTRIEARRRIETQIAQLQEQYSSHLDHFDHRWTGDRLDFAAGVMGMSISGNLRIEDQVVILEVALPWVLATLAKTTTQTIEQEGRKLLANKPSPGSGSAS